MHYKGFAKIIMPSNYVVSEKAETEANATKIIKDSLPLLDTLSNLINSDKNFNEPKKEFFGGLYSSFLNYDLIIFIKVAKNLKLMIPV